MTKKILLLFIATLFALGARSQVVPTISFANYVAFTDTMNSVSSAIDGSSKVYTTGRITNTTQDIIVQCTDSTGIVLWTYTYNNGGYDSPNKIRVDGSGNSYIVGTSNGTTTNHDYIIIKLNSSGSLVWSKRYDGGVSGGIDEAMDVCVDASGNVYVTGKSKVSTGDLNAVTLKLAASTGNILWQHSFNGSSLDDIGVCLTLAGNQSYVVVGANSNNATTNTNIVAYRLTASSGSLGWSNSINGTSNGIDKVSSIILAGGNVVLAGMLTNSGSGTDYVTTKFNVSSGTTVFQKLYSFSNTDVATSLVRDSTDNIVVTGTAFNTSTGSYEYHTIFYDSVGVSHWIHKKPLNASALNVVPLVVCDTIANHFYVVGEVQNATRDVMAYQLTPTGNLGWQKNFNAPPNGVDVGTGVVINGVGVLFICANTTNLAGKFDLTTIKIAQTPVYFPPDLGTPELGDTNFVFQQNMGQLLQPNGSAVPASNVAYYNQGTSPSIYVSNSKVSYMLIDKYAPQDSSVRVDLVYSGANSLSDIYSYHPLSAVKNYFTTSSIGITAVNSYGRLFVPETYNNIDVHHYSNSQGLKSYFVFKHPSESISMPRFQVTGADSSGIVGGYLIAYTKLGKINMGKLTAYQVNFNPSTYAYSFSSVPVNWLKASTNVYKFSVGTFSSIYALTVYLSKPGATSATAAGPNGNLYWSTYIGGQGNEQMHASRTDAKDNYYIGGSTTAINYPAPGAFQASPPLPSSSQYGIMNKFRNDGKLLYGTYYGGAASDCSPPLTSVQDIAIDSLYNIYLAGYTTSKNMKTKNVTGGLNDTINNATSGAGCTTAFIMKLNPTGNAMRFGTYYGGTNGIEKFNSVAYKNGQIHLGGNSGSTTIPLATPLPNTYQITAGNGMYVRLDTTGALKHNTKMHHGITAGAVDKNDNYYMLSQNFGSAALPVIAPASTFYTNAVGSGINWGLERISASDSLTWSTNIAGDFATNICIRDSVMALCGHGTSTTFTIVKTPSDSGNTANIAYPTGDNAQLMKFNLKTGQILWSVYYATLRDMKAYAVALDKDFNLYVTGYVNGNNSFNNFKLLSQPGYYQQNAEISDDAYLLGFNSKNQKRWNTYFGTLTTSGGPSEDDAYSMAMNNSNKLFIVGNVYASLNTMPMIRWNNTCYFDSLQSGGGDGFIAMFDVTNFKTVGIQEYSKEEIGNGLILFPNPNNGIFNLKFIYLFLNLYDVFRRKGRPMVTRRREAVFSIYLLVLELLCSS